ncbi:polyprenyl diphosphate synthase [Gluconobacter albidus]|uniref:Isoprenyl transferase n=1 Tax=Gluconobacter albidus TaxID=318683 RepID=A0ABQ5WXU4_9PROT|nr:polyprenyl diphosphate synthase [Gluconobacter albidus]MBS1027345.1 di-trans,poly-cis-decaprenylcistransferase [Gluconobacter albidus]GLQ68331.1 isoprenyl transferase [Gluconobacter albidus]
MPLGSFPRSEGTVSSPIGGGASAVPVHVAVIMDGNGRWARARRLPVIAGHRQGAESVQKCVRTAIQQGVRYLTLYAFSSENWRRSTKEVGDLTSLLRFYLRHKINELHGQGVRLRVIGEPERFEGPLREELHRAETLTLHNTTLTLTLALSYGGRAEIVQAARRLAEDAVAGRITPDSITENTLHDALQTADMPDPDLVIRTSGECRLSNFLLWQSAYAELIFMDVLWPDFGESEFLDALSRFAGRQRRFGGRPA